MKIFMSHSSDDAMIVNQIKDWIHEAFKGGVQIFSSSGGGLTLGDDWKDKILDELKDKDCEIAFALCSQSSLTKPWIAFEIGALWHKKAAIIPICFHGVNKSDLPEPYRFFQGVNIEIESDAKNLIKFIADKAKFDYSLLEPKTLKISPQQIKNDAKNSPDFRVYLFSARLGNAQTGWRDVVILKGENHSEQSVYLSSGIAFELENDSHKYLGVYDDFLTAQPFLKYEVKPGQSIERLINPANLLKYKDKLGRACFTDEIGRYYFSTIEDVQRTISDLQKKTPR